MRSFDTNVAVRLVIEDDPAQCDRADRAFRRAVFDRDTRGTHELAKRCGVRIED